MSPIKALLLDMDGVLWRGEQAIGDLPAILNQAGGMGLRTAFVTNNATRTIEQYLEKFKRMGAIALAEQIYTSAKATARYLHERYPEGGSVFMVGEIGLHNALQEAGFEVGSAEPLAVVVGLDSQVTYEKLKQATLLVRAGAPLIGTNPDRTLPTPEGLVPGAGALIATIEAAADVEATIIGKPQGALLQAALNDMGLKPSQALMVGDRLETDIAAGQLVGCPTALVLSGVTSQQAAEVWQPAPDYITDDLASLLERLSYDR